MAKYINADEFFASFDTIGNPDSESEFATDGYIDGFVDGVSAVMKKFETTPAADVQEIRHGCWTDQYNNGDWHCSGCGAIVEVNEQINHNWYCCYHCGARMDGGEK